MKKKLEKVIVGHIGVDAGLCWIGDPCYILHQKNNPKAIGENWSDFCGKVSDQATSFNYDLGHEGLGVCVSTGYGDGTYPVVATIKDGRIKSVTIKFF